MRIWGDKSLPHDYRARVIIPKLKELDLPLKFSIVDLACGHGTDIEEIQGAFPYANALGIDIDEFPEWKDKSVRFKKEDMMDFIKMPSRWDVVMMLNSYRNWEGSDRVAFDDWVKDHTKYFIASGNRDGGEIIGTDDGYDLKLWQFYT